MDYIADNAANCPRCGANLGNPGYQQPPQQYEQPPQQYQQPPQQYDQQYQQPPQQQGAYYPPQGGYYQPPAPPKRTPTVKRIDLTETILLVSGMFLFMGAMWNFSDLAGWGFYAPSLILGLLSLVAGMMALGMVLVPQLLKQLEGEIIDIIMLAFGGILALWGLVVLFAWNYGAGGEIVFIGGFGLLMAGLLRMGILK
jgi:hypothetical protein